MNTKTKLIVQCFKEKNFAPLTDEDNKRNLKQYEALKLLTDQETTELLFGGGAGSGKSYLGFLWLICMSLAYPETAYFIAREVLKTLRTHGMATFRKAAKKIHLVENVDWHFNGQYSQIHFTNDSRIDLIEVKLKPGDPEFVGVGGAEWTAGLCEEFGNSSAEAYDVLNLRVNRVNNEKYNILGVVLTTCNPSKNFLFSRFYLPHTQGTLPPGTVFLPALVTDNPHIDKAYIERLKNTKNPTRRAIYYEGNWFYSDNPLALLSNKVKRDMFTNEHLYKEGEKMRMTVDPATSGEDSAVFMVFEGDSIVCISELKKCTPDELHAELKELQLDFNISMSDICVDVVGLGEFLRYKGYSEFKAGRKAFDDKIYKNLKAEMGYKLSEKGRRIYFNCELTETQIQEIIQELDMLRSHNIDKDTRLEIYPKELIKKEIGRSPNYLDCLLMFIYLLEIDESRKFGFAGGTYNKTQ